MPHAVIRLLVRAGVVLLIAASLGAAAKAPPIRLVIGDIYPDSTAVRVDFVIENAMPEEPPGEPEEVPPAALAFTIETWRDRSAWFDQLVSTRTIGYRIERDRIRNLYRVTTPEKNQVEFTELDELAALLSRQTGVIGARLADLEPGKRHYFTIRTRLMPVDLNRVADAEQWMNGEIKTGGGGGGVLSIPKAALGWLAALTGLGDREVSARSRSFRRPEPELGFSGSR